MIKSIRESLFEIGQKSADYLDTLLELNFYTRIVLKRYILMLTESIKDEENELPISHIAISNALNDIFDHENWDKTMEKSPDLILHSFCEHLVKWTMDFYNIEIHFNDKDIWNLEKCIFDEDFLLKKLVTNHEKQNIVNYEFKNKKLAEKKLLERLLTKKYVDSFKNNKFFYAEASLPKTLKINRTFVKTPIFKVI